MRSILTMFGSWISGISDTLDFGPDASVATMILFLIIGIVLAITVVKFLKKIVGKFVTIILVIVIAFTSGTLSFSQFKNFAEGAGIIYKDGLPEATEEDGLWLFEIFEQTSPEDAGTWVPQK